MISLEEKSELLNRAKAILVAEYHSRKDNRGEEIKVYIQDVAIIGTVLYGEVAHVGVFIDNAHLRRPLVTRKGCTPYRWYHDEAHLIPRALDVLRAHMVLDDLAGV